MKNNYLLLFLILFLILFCVNLFARPVIVMTGFWNPTGEMLAPFSTDPNLNPDGWIGENWEESGYDVYSYFPNPEDYSGVLEVDYQNVWSDFWSIMDEKNPIAIISFGAGVGPFEIEMNARNLINWYSDGNYPYYPTPNPPDSTVATNFVRHSTLPVENIAAAVNDETNVSAWIDWNGNPGAFLCEYTAYLGMWYKDLHSSQDDPNPCLSAGFIHLIETIPMLEARETAMITLQEVIYHLDSFVPVNGNVVLNDAIDNAIITLHDETNSYTTETDENGNFIFNFVKSGDYTLSAVADGIYYSNQEVTINSENNNFVIYLNDWTPTSIVNYYSGSSNLYNADLPYPVEFAIKLSPEEYAGFTSGIIGKINFIAPDSPNNCTIIAKIYSAPLNETNPQILEYEQLITEFSENEWINHLVTSPVKITADKNYWVGYQITSDSGDFCFFDDGPMYEDKGGWMKLSSWFTFPMATGIDANLFIDAELFHENGVENQDDVYPIFTNVKNYPNPFSLNGKNRSQHITIEYNLNAKHATDVELSIYNIKGQRVKSLVSEKQKNGIFRYFWDGRDSNNKVVSNGIYFYQIKSANHSLSKKMLILK